MSFLVLQSFRCGRESSSPSFYCLLDVIVLCHFLAMRWVDLLRNDFEFWNVHGIMNTFDLLQSYVGSLAK